MREQELFKQLKKEVLGSRYDLSVAFLTPAEMRKVTKKTKRKNKVSNVLAFPLSSTSGEILLCRKAAKPYTPAYLFIHGLLHLKGFKHGARMEREENRIMHKFGFQVRGNRK